MTIDRLSSFGGVASVKGLLIEMANYRHSDLRLKTLRQSRVVFLQWRLFNLKTSNIVGTSNISGCPLALIVSHLSRTSYNNLMGSSLAH